MTEYIYTAETIKAWDAYTIQQQQISSLQLMEQAALACVEKLLEHFADAKTILIVAGPGNNGGDGIAMARMLADRNRKLSVYRLAAAQYSQDNAAQWERLMSADIKELPVWDPALIQAHDLVIDALLGIGVNRPLSGLAATIVEDLDAASRPVVSIDLPSGMPAELAFDATWPVVRAKHTFSLGSYKLNQLLAHGAPFVGRLSCIDIGLSRTFVPTTGVIGQAPGVEVLAQLLPNRSTFSHKGSFGHALLVAGSAGSLGAAVLAGKACARTGAGLTSLAVPENLHAALALGLPEVMSLASGATHWTKDINLSKYTSLGIGPGIGTKRESFEALRNVLATARCPMVLDADALNLLAAEPGGIDLIPKGSILTPHVKEFDRLFGPQPDWWSRLASLQTAANRRSLVIVLKNAYTFIAAPHERLCVNFTGNPGLAKGGSGDVLTGIIAALLAQGISPASAATLGVWIHGSSADHAVKRIGEIALLGSDVIASIPAALDALIFHQMN